MYTIKQASLRSGVGVPLLRAWERRYGVVQPVRTPAGYRLYDDEAIERLRAMRQLVDAGWAPREAAPRVIATDASRLGELRQASVDAATPGRLPDSEADRVVGDIVRAAAALDLDALEGALDVALTTARFESAAQEIVLPALVEIGAAWSAGRVDVAAEHAASAAILRRLGAAYQAAGSPPDGPLVVVGMPPGAQHELAALAFAVAARRAGMRVIYLGANVPAESWLTAVTDSGAAAVVLGAVLRRDADASAAVFADLAARAPQVLRFVGGRHAGVVSGEGHVVLPDRLEDAVRAVRQAVAPAAGR